MGMVVVVAVIEEVAAVEATIPGVVVATMIVEVATHGIVVVAVLLVAAILA